MGDGGSVEEEGGEGEGEVNKGEECGVDAHFGNKRR